ncbi:MAG: hypothetical protein GX575_17430 [Candidatus Anammoximicrobium sp.]|nr:hypothetical protein [Candidatus Anammoximicrobium sp.]
MVVRCGSSISVPHSTMDAESKSNRPVKVFRARGVTASIFENESKTGDTFHKVTLQRTYHDGKEFKTTDSFSRDDLPIAGKLLADAWAFVLETEEEKKKGASKEA